MLMHAIAHGGIFQSVILKSVAQYLPGFESPVRQGILSPRGDTERDLHWKLTLGDKIPCPTGDSKPGKYCARLFSITVYQLSYPLVAVGSSSR